MKKYKCTMCEKYFTTFQALGGHYSTHYKRNKPNKNLLPKIIVKKICPKCGKEFSVYRNIKKDGSQSIRKKEQSFCGRRCANTKEFTNEQNNKKGRKGIQNKLYKYGSKEPVPCKKCEKPILKTGKYGYCQKCLKYSSEYKNDIKKARENLEYRYKCSISLKEQYKNGKKVYGGKTKWYNYKNIKVQGSYELRTCMILDKWLENKKILKWEYTKDRVEYIDEENNTRNYLIDFKIFELNGNFYYLEVKGYIRKNDIKKWEAVRNKGFKIIIWFLKNIENEENIINAIIGL